MDIRGILQSDACKLLEEELEMLEEELAVGEFEASYRKECKLLIEQERHARKTAHLVKKTSPKEQPGKKYAAHGGEGSVLPHGVAPATMGPIESLSPFNALKEEQKTPREIVAADISVIRRSRKRKSLFREYVRKQQLVDEEFLDANLSLFDEWELAAILDERCLSEEFLEKYFDSLDKDKIAVKQVFSEEYFMRHFSGLDAHLVLERGKNPWRHKEARSRKLDTFLRLKGVRF